MMCNDDGSEGKLERGPETLLNSDTTVIISATRHTPARYLSGAPSRYIWFGLDLCNC